MQCIPFDEWFSKYLTEWISENGAAYRHDMNRMEEQMPAVYEKFLSTPAKWLGGMAPGNFFDQYTDASLLVSWMIAYVKENIPTPDLLLNRITMLGEDAENSLFSVLTDKDAPLEARILSISLLTELDSAKPMAFYIELIATGNERDELVDHAAEALGVMGPSIVKPALAAAQKATRAGQEAFLNCLCNYPGEPGILELAISLFEKDAKRKALYASLLGKLGDDGAISVLQDAIADPALSYLDYIEIRNAIEMLGGDVVGDREFFGDPGFEALKRMK